MYEFICSPGDGHLGLLYILAAIINCYDYSINVFSGYVYSFSSYLPKNIINES